METISHQLHAVYPSFALPAGCELEVFTALKDGARSADQIAEALGVGVEKLRPLPYAPVTTGLLMVEDHQFRNSPEAEAYLVKGDLTPLSAFRLRMGAASSGQ